MDSGKAKTEDRKREGRQALALGRRLSRCRNVRTLGVLPNFSDYPEEDRQAMADAPRIYYPGSLYSGVFAALKKPCFPGPAQYFLAQDKPRQTAMLQAAGIPHPRTRLYYGQTQQKSIEAEFGFPLVAKTARGSSQGAGVALVESPLALASYLARNHEAYIQEPIPGDRDVRVVAIAGRPVLSYWRIAPPDSFFTNIARGGRIDFDNIPPEAVDLAVLAARKLSLDDVGIDVRLGPDGPLVVEINAKYGRQAFEQAGIDYFRLMEGFIENGVI